MAMATNIPFSSAPLPFKAIKDEEIEDTSQYTDPRKEYNNLISTLPKKIYSRKYQGFWLPEKNLPGVLSIQQHFIPRPTDIFLASFPKSGTTWLKALIFAIMTRTQYPLTQHPLLSLNPHDCVPYMDEIFAVGKSNMLEKLPSPRILHTHIPFSILPDSITSSDCRIIYVWRDPKDSLVSLWQFIAKTQEACNVPFDLIFSTLLKQCTKYLIFRYFCDGELAFCPVWDHILEYWNESVRRPEKVLFLKYEEMLKDPKQNVKRLAEFVGCKFSEEEERGGIIEEVVELCSFKNLKELNVNKIGTQGILLKYPNDAYFRKGEAGDWRNHMTEKMAIEIDGIIQEKFAGSGLNI